MKMQKFVIFVKISFKINILTIKKVPKKLKIIIIIQVFQIGSIY